MGSQQQRLRTFGGVLLRLRRGRLFRCPLRLGCRAFAITVPDGGAAHEPRRHRDDFAQPDPAAAERGGFGRLGPALIPGPGTPVPTFRPYPQTESPPPPSALPPVAVIPFTWDKP